MADLVTLKEVAKISTDKEEIKSLLLTIPFIKLSFNKEVAHYELEPKIAVFSLLNVPQKMTKAELIALTHLDESKVLRVYKKALFWIVVVDEKTFFEEVRRTLKAVRSDKLSDGTLKFDAMSSASLMLSIQKILQNRDYHKEASDLKAEKRMSKDYNSNSSNKERTNSEALSWRKKSNEGNGLTQPNTMTMASPTVSEE